MSPAVLLGIQLALTLLEGTSNITVAITEMNVAISTARSEGRVITLDELFVIAQANRTLTDEVTDLLKGE